MPREDERARLARQWLVKAERDLLAAERSLVGSPPLRDVATYHWQQAAEKALKAFLTWHNRPFRKSHDLLYLLQECEAVDYAFSQLEDAGILLNPYVTEFRYPSDLEEPSAEATDLARDKAKDIVQFVRASLLKTLQP